MSAQTGLNGCGAFPGSGRGLPEGQAQLSRPRASSHPGGHGAPAAQSHPLVSIHLEPGVGGGGGLGRALLEPTPRLQAVLFAEKWRLSGSLGPSAPPVPLLRVGLAAALVGGRAGDAEGLVSGHPAWSGSGNK